MKFCGKYRLTGQKIYTQVLKYANMHGIIIRNYIFPKGYITMFRRIVSILLISAVLVCTSCGDNSSENAALQSVTIATSENLEINGAVMTYFYNDNMLAFINNYAAVLDRIGLDPTKPFSEQPRKNGEGTWHDFFMSQATTVAHYLMALNELAIADGISLSDAEKAAIEASAKAVPDGSYGNGVGTEDIIAARQLEALAYKYENTKKAELMPTLDEIKAYIAEEEADFEYDESRTVNVRHILVSGDAAVVTASKILDEFKGGEGTTEEFALLALEYSKDPGSCYSGGLYKNLMEGSTVEEFDEWCFDESRKAGDTAIVGTEHGAHVMYFEGEGLPVWQAEMADKIASERLKDIRVERFEDYPVTFNTEALGIIG